MRTDAFPANSELALAESNGKLYLLGGYMEGDLTWPAVGRLVPAAFVGQIHQLANQVESRPNLSSFAGQRAAYKQCSRSQSCSDRLPATVPPNEALQWTMGREHL